jgi:hypothetical protein
VSRGCRARDMRPGGNFGAVTSWPPAGARRRRGCSTRITHSRDKPEASTIYTSAAANASRSSGSGSWCVMRNSIASSQTMCANALRPDGAKPPARKYLDWHRERIFAA